MQDAPVPDSSETVEVRVRRTPRYGAFMALGAVVGAVLAWLAAVWAGSLARATAGAVDTSPVVGLSVVVGFTLGAAVGGLAALVIDRMLQRRVETAQAERTVSDPESSPPATPDAPKQSDET